MDTPLLAAPALPSEVDFVDLDHCRLAYRQVGQGDPLLLVHGSRCTA